jgi:hypothetical protein
MKGLARLAVAVVAAFAAAVSTFVLLGFVSMPLERFESQPLVYHGVTVGLWFSTGFVFVLVGAAVARSRHAIISALGWLGLGIGFYTYFQVSYTSSSDGFPVWSLIAAIAGGLAAVGVPHLRRHEGHGS